MSQFQARQIKGDDAHSIDISDITATAGYGLSGRGTWLVVCRCGWLTQSTHGGRNGASDDGRAHLREWTQRSL